MSRVIVRPLNVLGQGAASGPLAAAPLTFSGIDSVALTNQTMVATGGNAPYTYTAVGFPAGVTIGLASGIVSGTPTTPGVYPATVTVADSGGHSISVGCAFVVYTGTFADTFNRADQPFYVGNAWSLIPYQQGTMVVPNLAAAINVVGSTLQLSNASTNGANETQLFPLVVSWDQIYTNHAQYAQCTINGDNSGGANFAANGPSVLMNGNAATGYFIATNSTGAGNAVLKYVITSMNGGGAQTKIDTNGGAGFTYANGDVLRIEAYPNNPVANQTTIKHYRNGVLQNSLVDSTNHYNSGTYGIFDFFVSASITQGWQNFQGGILS